jgi:hypothetical protein
LATLRLAGISKPHDLDSTATDAFGVKSGLRKATKYILRAILLTIALLYFLIDLLFLSVLRPLRQRLMRSRPLQGMRNWVGTLNRYAALLLLIVPWLILEPVKPIAFLLFTRKHHAAATLLIVGGEIVKLTLLDQVLDMAWPKLMTFAWFAWCHARWQAALATLRSLAAWRWVRDRYRTARAWLVRRLRVAR